MANVKRYRDENDKIYVKIDLERALKIVRDIIEDPDYLRNLKRRALAGVLAPAVEMMLWHYLIGKPSETVNVNVNYKGEDLTKLSDEQLAEKARLLSDKILTDKPKQQLLPSGGDSDPRMN